MTTKSNLADNSVLNWIERSGNKLPDPVFIFVWCIFTVIIISVIASFFGYSALHPTLLDEKGNKSGIKMMNGNVTEWVR